MRAKTELEREHAGEDAALVVAAATTAGTAGRYPRDGIEGDPAAGPTGTIEGTGRLGQHATEPAKHVAAPAVLGREDEALDQIVVPEERCSTIQTGGAEPAGDPADRFGPAETAGTEPGAAKPPADATAWTHPTEQHSGRRYDRSVTANLDRRRTDGRRTGQYR